MAAKFQKALSPSVPSTMTGLTSPDTDPNLIDTPPPVPGASPISQGGSPGGVPDTSPYDKSISDAEDRLNTLLGQYPEIDFQGKYNDIKNQIQNQQVPKNPNPLASFAYTLGSPQNAPGNIKDQVLLAHQEQAQKEKDYLDLQQKLIQGDIQQQMAKGQFGLALKQSEKLRAIEQAQDDRKRYLDLHGKMDLQNQKYARIQQIAKTKIAAAIASFHLPERLQLQARDAWYKLYQAKEMEKNAFGMDVNSPDQINDEIYPQWLDMVRGLSPGAIPGGAGGGKKKAPPEAPEVTQARKEGLIK